MGNRDPELVPDEERLVEPVLDDHDPGAASPPPDEADEEIDPMAPARGVIGDPDDFEPNQPV